MNGTFSFLGGQEYGVLYVNSYVIQNAVDSRHEYIAGAAHMNYTDLPLLPRQIT